jgi:hypothetical protein
MESLLEVIERALKAQGKSARQASLEATGAPELVRMMRRGHAPSVERVQALCNTLGLEFYVGPPRDGTPSEIQDDAERALIPRPLTSFSSSVELPVRRWAHCSPEGYLTPAPRTKFDRAPAPVDLVDPHAFYAREPGFTMVPADLEAGNYCLISPCGQLEVGQRVWLRNRTGQETIKWLLELTAAAYELRAWRPPDPTTGRQEMIADRWMRDIVVDRGVVLAVYRNEPSVKQKTHRAADWRPERVAARWQRELLDPKMVRVDLGREGVEKPEGPLAELHGDVDKLKQSTAALEHSTSTLQAQMDEINGEVSKLGHSTSIVQAGMEGVIRQVSALTAALGISPPAGQQENPSDGGRVEDD